MPEKTIKRRLQDCDAALAHDVGCLMTIAPPRQFDALVAQMRQAANAARNAHRASFKHHRCRGLLGELCADARLGSGTCFDAAEAPYHADVPTDDAIIVRRDEDWAYDRAWVGRLVEERDIRSIGSLGVDGRLYRWRNHGRHSRGSPRDDIGRARHSHRPLRASDGRQ
jgi:hypothetical protein